MADKPTPEIEAQGLRAYEQVLAFERLRTLRLPLVYGGAAAIPLFLAYSAWRSGNGGLACVAVVFSAFISLLVVMQWRRLLRQYAENRALLEKLESTYGDALPWIQVEQHFAALVELKREIAEGRASDPRE